MELSKGRLIYTPDFIENANEIFEELKKIKWDPPSATMVQTPGGWKNIPRDQAAFADPGVKAYYFAGQHAQHQPMPEVILKLRKRVRELTGADYNYAIVNHYADGSKYISPHHDSREGLVDGSSIVGISFGATRRLQIVPDGKEVDEVKPQTMEVEHNSMFQFDWSFNFNYKHGIAKSTDKSLGPRISVTFRDMKVTNQKLLLSIHATDESIAAVLFNATDQRMLIQTEEKIEGREFSKACKKIHAFCSADLDKEEVDIITCQPEVTVRVLMLGGGRERKGLPPPPLVTVDTKPEKHETAGVVAHRNIAAWKAGKTPKPGNTIKKVALEYFNPTGAKDSDSRKRKAM